MRRLWFNLVVAAVATLVPTWALAGNQEIADHIAANLRNSGQMHDYEIGVKYQNGTVWLKGQVVNAEQQNVAMDIAARTPGVTRVVNNMRVAGVPNAVALQQVQGAMAPEQFARGAPASQTTRLPEVAPRPTVQADRVAAVVTPSAAPVRSIGLQESAAPAATRSVPVAYAQAPAQAAPVPAAAPLPIPAPAPATSMAPAPVAVPAPLPQQGAPLPMAAGQPMPQYVAPAPGGVAAARFDQPRMPAYAWPSYAAYPNYAAVTYPRQYSPTAWPYIGPFYPYPQVPLGWRKVTLEWHDGWWNLDFDDGGHRGPVGSLFRPYK